MERKYSDPCIYDNSIDHDDRPDGSEGGYDRHGNYIIPAAMMELVTRRKQLEAKVEQLVAVTEAVNTLIEHAEVYGYSGLSTVLTHDLKSLQHALQ